MPAIERDDHLYHLVAEPVDANGDRCPECGDVGPGHKLYTYWSVRGNKSRRHEGTFCSRDCHDIWHGLKAYSKT